MLMNDLDEDDFAELNEEAENNELHFIYSLLFLGWGLWFDFDWVLLVEIVMVWFMGRLDFGFLGFELTLCLELLTFFLYGFNSYSN